MKKEEVMKVIHPHLAPTDECQCEAYREYLKTGENKQPNYWIDAECKKYDHYSDRNTMFKEREPQKECDHIVGFLSNNQDGGAAPIHQSDSMAKVLEANELLKYCPECGEKVNWAVIERSLNLKKDE